MSESRSMRRAADPLFHEIQGDLDARTDNGDDIAQALGDRLRVVLQGDPAPTHRHDGYAYEGCQCVCCTNVRALSMSRAALQGDADAPVGGLDVRPRMPCRCGARVLVENWDNHLERQSNQPHYAIGLAAATSSATTPGAETGE